MSPLQITTLLAVHCYVDEKLNGFGLAELHARGMVEAKDNGITWISQHALGWTGDLIADRFTLTPKGRAMVRALLGLPLPQAHTEIKTTWDIPGTDFEFAESEL